MNNEWNTVVALWIFSLNCMITPHLVSQTSEIKSCGAHAQLLLYFTSVVLKWCLSGYGVIMMD